MARREHTYQLGDKVVVRGRGIAVVVDLVEQSRTPYGKTEPEIEQTLYLYAEGQLDGAPAAFEGYSPEVRPFVDPVVGMGATYCIGSDAYGMTIVKVSPSGKTIEVQFDDSKLTSGSIFSEAQKYEHTPNPRASTIKATLRADGTFRPVGADYSSVSVGTRHTHRDPHK